MFDLFSICPFHPTKLYTLAFVTPWRCVLSPSGTEPSVSRSHKIYLACRPTVVVVKRVTPSM